MSIIVDMRQHIYDKSCIRCIWYISNIYIYMWVVLPIYFDKYYHNPVKLYICNKLLNLVYSYTYLEYWIQRIYLMKFMYI